MKTFGERLTEARDRTGLSKSKLARLVGINKMTVTSLENQTNKSTTPENLFKFADILHCSARWLATGQGDIDGDENDRPSYNVSSEQLLVLMDDLSEVKRQDLIKLAEDMIRLEQKIKKVIDSA